MMEKLSAEEFDLNYQKVLERLKTAAENSGRDMRDITLLAATKTVDADTINYAIEKGITHIGENRVQELLSKYSLLKVAHSHFIGHLQTNKVKDIIDKVENKKIGSFIYHCGKMLEQKDNKALWEKTFVLRVTEDEAALQDVNKSKYYIFDEVCR